MANLEATPQWLRSMSLGRPVGVDREAGVIRGYVVAERGPFKSQGRGEFNDKALGMIVDQMNAARGGLKARFTHPGLSSDGLGKFLGRSSNAWLDGGKVRADLQLSPTSRNTPHGDLGGYVMDLAEDDAGALGSSLVLQVEQVWRKNEDGSLATDTDGEELPPLWYPKKLHASDIVDDGDAVHGPLLSTAVDFTTLPDSAVRLGTQALDAMFPGQSREVVQARVEAWLSRYLDNRYGELPKLSGRPIDMLRRRARLREQSRNLT